MANNFYDAVDIVCMECFFVEDTCETCPVRKVVDYKRKEEKTKQKEREGAQTVLRTMFK